MADSAISSLVLRGLGRYWQELADACDREGTGLVDPRLIGYAEGKATVYRLAWYDLCDILEAHELLSRFEQAGEDD